MILVYTGNSNEWFPRQEVSVYVGWADEVDDKIAKFLLPTGKFVRLEDKHLYDKTKIIKDEDIIEPHNLIGE